MSYQRTNNAYYAHFKDSRPFSKGRFKLVWKGVYTKGTRKGEACVSKEFKTGSVYEEWYFDKELDIIDRAQRIIDDWHEERIIDCPILLSTPEIWVSDGDDESLSLVEPMIENFEKFDSNTGWANITGGLWSDDIQALSHFSYHRSGGQLLLCDLQGGAYKYG
jgi:hypothetical protein